MSNELTEDQKTSTNYTTWVYKMESGNVAGIIVNGVEADKLLKDGWALSPNLCIETSVVEPKPITKTKAKKV